MSATDVGRVLVGLPPLIDQRSRVLVLGSFPSKLSLQRREYYGNPQNHFWQMMEVLFGIERQAPYAQRTAQLLEERVAVWDVIAECSREGSGDDAIMDATPNSVLALLRDYPGISRVAFNGGMASRSARMYVADLFDEGGVAWERFPSTSPRNAKMPLAAKVEAWSKLRSWLGESG